MTKLDYSDKALGLRPDTAQSHRSSSPSPAPAAVDWRYDPSADEQWNAGCDFAMMQLCHFLGVDPATVDWDAATETLDGDVQSVIGKILRAKLGEDWGPSAPAPAAVEDLVARLHGIEKGVWYQDRLVIRDTITALSTLAADKARIEAERDRLRGMVEGECALAEALSAAEARATAAEAERDEARAELDDGMRDYDGGYEAGQSDAANAVEAAEARASTLQTELDELRRVLLSLLWMPKIRAVLDALPPDDCARVYAEQLGKAREAG